MEPWEIAVWALAIAGGFVGFGMLVGAIIRAGSTNRK